MGKSTPFKGYPSKTDYAVARHARGKTLVVWNVLHSMLPKVQDTFSAHYREIAAAAQIPLERIPTIMAWLSSERHILQSAPLKAGGAYNIKVLTR